MEYMKVKDISAMHPRIGGVLAYLLVIVSGRRLMAGHNPFDMRRVFLAHNAILCVWSISMCIGCALYALPAMFVRRCRVQRRLPTQISLCSTLYHFDRCARRTTV